MADTYKHKLQYKAKHFKHYWGQIPIKENPFEDFPWHKVPRNDSSKKWARFYLQHSFRQQTKRLLEAGKYDELPIRPTRYAWIID